MISLDSEALQREDQRQPGMGTILFSKSMSTAQECWRPRERDRELPREMKRTLSKRPEHQNMAIRNEKMEKCTMRSAHVPAYLTNLTKRITGSCVSLGYHELKRICLSRANSYFPISEGLTTYPPFLHISRTHKRQDVSDVVLVAFDPVNETGRRDHSSESPRYPGISLFECTSKGMFGIWASRVTRDTGEAQRRTNFPQ